MSDIVLARNCCLARMLPGEAENGVGMNRSVREGKIVKRFERSNGLDTALYKNYLYLYLIVWLSHVSVPMRMSGSDSEMKLPSSAVLFLKLWKFILMILKGL